MPGNAWECLGVPGSAWECLGMPAKGGNACKSGQNACECLQNWAKACKYLQITDDLGAWLGAAWMHGFGRGLVCGLGHGLGVWLDLRLGGVAWGRGLARLGGVT